MSVYVCDWVIFVCFRTQNGISMTPIAVFMPLCLRVYSCARFGCFSLSFFLCLSCWERRRCMHSEFGIVSIWNGTYWTIQFCYSSAFCRLFTTQIDNRNKSNRRTPCSPNKCRISQWEILTQLALLWFNADRENLLFTLDDFSSDIFQVIFSPDISSLSQIVRFIRNSNNIDDIIFTRAWWLCWFPLFFFSNHPDQAKSKF